MNLLDWFIEKILPIILASLLVAALVALGWVLLINIAHAIKYKCVSSHIESVTRIQPPVYMYMGNGFAFPIGGNVPVTSEEEVCDRYEPR